VQDDEILMRTSVEDTARLPDGTKSSRMRGETTSRSLTASGTDRNSAVKSFPPHLKVELVRL